MGRRLNQRDFEPARKTPWRTIFIGIILLTIPLYIIGLGLWLFAPSANAPTPTPSATAFLTFTPLGQNGATPNATSPGNASDALGNSLLTLVATQSGQATPGFIIVTTSAPFFVPSATNAFQPVTFVAPSQVPTFFVTSTPTIAPTATQTSVATIPPPATHTPAPQPTQPILLPPTNTPQP